MEIKSLHVKGHTISIVPKALSLGLELAKEAHSSCKLYLQLPYAYVYGGPVKFTHTLEVDDHESN